MCHQHPFCTAVPPVLQTPPGSVQTGRTGGAAEALEVLCLQTLQKQVWSKTKRRAERAHAGRDNAEMNHQDSITGSEIQLLFLHKTVKKMLYSQEALDCQKQKSAIPSPTSFESFIFSFYFLGRGILVATL